MSNAVDPVAIECATYVLYPGTSTEVADAYTYCDFFEYDLYDAPSNLDKFLTEVSQCA